MRSTNIAGPADLPGPLLVEEAGVVRLVMGKFVGVLLGLTIAWHALPARAEQRRAASASPEAAPRNEKPAPPRRLRDRNAGARLGLIVGGTIAFGVFYGLPCAGARGLWCVPFAGPVLVVDKREREQSGSRDDGQDGIVPPVFIYTLAGGLGMLQLGGAAMITIGALLPRRDVEVPARRITLLPLVGPAATGITAMGSW